MSSTTELRRGGRGVRRGDLRGRRAETGDIAEDMKPDRYPRYVLGALVVVYVFNFLDRQILSSLSVSRRTWA
jgi:hypothetical protein